MQFSASRSGANSGSGKEGWCRNMNSRLVAANMRVSRFSRAASRVLRISAGEKRLKISSLDSGSSQNCVQTRSVDVIALVFRLAYRCPVWIIGGYDFALRKFEDALLEHELRVGGSHSELCRAFVAESAVDVPEFHTLVRIVESQDSQAEI